MVYFCKRALLKNRSGGTMDADMAYVAVEQVDDINFICMGIEVKFLEKADSKKPLAYMVTGQSNWDMEGLREKLETVDPHFVRIADYDGNHGIFTIDELLCMDSADITDLIDKRGSDG